MYGSRRGPTVVVIVYTDVLEGMKRVCQSGPPHAWLPPFSGTRIFERLPAPLWPTLAPSPVADRLSRSVKQAYDPRGILNPGKIFSA